VVELYLISWPLTSSLQAIKLFLESWALISIEIFLEGGEVNMQSLKISPANT
jgi:hypothetical protein